MSNYKSADLGKLKKLFKTSVYTPKLQIQDIRMNYENIFYEPHLPNNVDLKETILRNVPIDIISAEMTVLGRAIFYVHGGSFISGSRKAYRNLCASLAHESSANLFLPEYRLAPENPFPAALEDLYNVYAAMIEVKKIAPNKTVFAGDGAGAGLVLALIHYLKSKALPLPNYIVLLSPWADLTCADAGLNINRKKDFIFKKDSLFDAAKLYTHQGNFTNELVSPLLGNFENFPPIFIQCGGNEILLSDSKRIVQNVEEAGGVAELDVWEDMWHLFQAVSDYTVNAHIAVEKIGLKIQESFSLENPQIPCKRFE